MQLKANILLFSKKDVTLQRFLLLYRIRTL